VRLLSIGKIHHAGEGCACPMGFVAKQFLKNLKLLDNEMVIIDTEAVSNTLDGELRKELMLF
jgi:CO dehydrogenase maturation factor